MDLELWHDSMKVAQRLFDLAEGLEAKKLHQLAEQLRGAGLSLIAPCFFSLLGTLCALRYALGRLRVSAVNMSSPNLASFASLREISLLLLPLCAIRLAHFKLTEA